MPLSAGEHLGPYEIIALLGSGGMGEVYKARDRRLDRTVAIKVLSAHIDSADTRDRFNREARTVSSLTHPNICALYDVGSKDDALYLVMEYLEGETLAARLTRGPLPVEKVFEYGIQIADALDHAHRHGVVHRDLKPGNVMITRSGAKLLDFGLATTLAFPETSRVSQISTHSMTIVGTAQYMAPELLEGKEADARSDIFAFGALLYEMATGRRAFQGNTQAVIIAGILEREPPPISSLDLRMPLALTHLVQTCLSKDPEERRQSAHDVLLELKWMAQDVSQLGGPALVPRRVKRARRLWIAASGLAAVALVLGWLYYQRRPEELPMVRTSVLAPEKTTFVASSLPAISSDGRKLAFASSAERRGQLWVRELDSLAANAVAGTEGANDPFWSPDGRAVAFFAAGKLKKVELRGGPAVVLCDALQGRGGTWSPNGTIVFAPNTNGPLYRVPSTGGNPTPVTTLDQSREEVSHRFPWFLPDGHHFLFTGRSTDPAKNAIYVGDTESNQQRRIAPVSSNAAYAPPGFLLFVRERVLMAQFFNARSFQLSGEPFPIAEPVDFITGNVQGSFSVSQNGTLAYYSAGAGLNSRLTWFDRGGKALGNVGPAGSYFAPALSPDGGTLAADILDSQTGTYDLWLYDLARNTGSRFTTDPKHDDHPIWSPDGTRIAFSSDRKGHYDLYQKSVNGAEKEELLLESPLPKFPSDWSKDGRFIVYYQLDPKTKFDLWLLPRSGDAGSRKPVPLLQTPFNESWAKISPDGRWLAYTSDETGSSEVYVQSFPSLGGKWKVSVDGGSRPVWRRDGKELFYIGTNLKLMAATVKPGSSFQTSSSKPLFDTRLTSSRLFDVSQDGRFLVINPIEEPTPPMTVVVNWNSKIRRP